MAALSEFIQLVRDAPWSAGVSMLNALACFISATMLGTYQRNGAKHRFSAGVMAFILIVACGSVTILIATGNYKYGYIPEAVINVMLCISLISSRGNVMKIFRRDDKQ